MTKLKLNINVWRLKQLGASWMLPSSLSYPFQACYPSASSKEPPWSHRAPDLKPIRNTAAQARSLICWRSRSKNYWHFVQTTLTHTLHTHPPTPPPILNLVCFFVWKKKCFFVSSLLNPLWSPSLWSRHSGLYLCCFLVGFWVEENLDNHIGTFRNEQAVDSVNTPWATWSGQGLASGLHLPRICLEAGSGSCSLLQRAH